MIGVVVPTRRPQEFLKCATSAVSLSTNAHVLAYVDHDQEGEYRALELPERVKLHVGPRCGPTASVNALVQAFPDYDIYGVCPDDCGFTTPEWDVYVERTIAGFPNRLGVLSPAHNFGPFVNFPFVSKRWIDTLGWFAFPKMYHFCWDTVLELLGEQTHMVFAGRDEMMMANQAIPAFNYDSHFRADCEQFLWWAVLERNGQAKKLREAMGG